MRGRRDARRSGAAGPRRAAVRQPAGDMNAPASRRPLNWSARLLIGLALIIVGAAAATWMLARYDRAAHVLGVAPAPPPLIRSPQRLAAPLGGPAAESDIAVAARMAGLEARVARVETAARR